jgi:hypothetical protein
VDPMLKHVAASAALAAVQLEEREAISFPSCAAASRY